MFKIIINLLLFLFSIPLICSSQVSFRIDTLFTEPKDSYGAKTIIPFDLDIDGDLDILYTAESGPNTSWYENDGYLNFYRHDLGYLTNLLICPIDLDQDRDIDIISTMSSSHYTDKIIWYENDGMDNFKDNLVSLDVSAPRSLHAYDFDKDGDIDILCSSIAGQKRIAWYENNGYQNFESHTVSDTLDYPVAVLINDLDSDEDLDIIGVGISKEASFLIWFENKGNQNYKTNVINQVYGPSAILAFDLDKDNDVDIITDFYGKPKEKIIWYENDGNQNFTKHFFETNSINIVGLSAADFDQDDDIDLMSVSHSNEINENKVVFYENNGNQEFNFVTIDSARLYGLNSSAAIDMDNDSDMDLLTISSTDNYIIFYENLIKSPLNNGFLLKPFILQQNFPNPFNSTTKILYELESDNYVRLIIYDILGNEIKKLINNNQNIGEYSVVFNAFDLASGIYIYRLIVGSQEESRKMLLLR